MDCPHCKQTLQVDSVCYRNADTFNNSVSATTQCCGQLVRIIPIRTFNVCIDTSDATEDDWGNPVSEKIDANPLTSLEYLENFETYFGRKSNQEQ